MNGIKRDLSEEKMPCGCNELASFSKFALVRTRDGPIANCQDSPFTTS